MSRRQSFIKEAASCKVCKDSGKPYHVYQNHNIRDVRGFICCPTIKMNRCSKCNCQGHFPKFCPGKSEYTVKSSLSYIKKEMKSGDTFPVLQEKQGNRFIDMCDDSDEEILSPNVTVRVDKLVPIKRKNWADMCDDSDKEKLSPNVTVRVDKLAPLKRKYMNWVDMDSDNDE